MKRKLCLGRRTVGYGAWDADQRFVITGPAAMCFVIGETCIGATPVDDHFVYYGKYHFTLIMTSYETLQVDQDIPALFYEYPLVDFVEEVLVPPPHTRSCIRL